MSGNETTGLTPEPLGSQIFRLILSGIIFILAIGGNMLVIFVVYRTRELRNATGWMMANLAAADLGVSILCIPFTTIYIQIEYWPFGRALCKVIPTVQPMTLVGSVGSLTAIAADRYNSIVHPFSAVPLSRTDLRLLVAIIWLWSLFVGLPMLGSNDVFMFEGLPICDEIGWPSLSMRKLYTVFTFAITYAAPLPIITILYVKMVFKLREAALEAADRPGFLDAQAKKRIVKMMVAVVVCYAICYLPYHIISLYVEFYEVPPEYQSITYLLRTYALHIVYFNSASNPLLYGFFSKQFRKHVKGALRGKRKNRYSISTKHTRMMSYSSSIKGGL